MKIQRVTPTGRLSKPLSDYPARTSSGTHERNERSFTMGDLMDARQNKTKLEYPTPLKSVTITDNSIYVTLSFQELEDAYNFAIQSGARTLIDIHNKEIEDAG